MMENDETNGSNEQINAQQSRKFLTFYILGLFSVALVLIILSYLTQVKSNEALDALNNELGQQTYVAEGAKDKAQQLQNIVNEQNQKISKLTDELNLSVDQNEQLEKTKTALNMIVQLQATYYEKNYDKCKQIIGDIDAEYYQTLDNETKTIFDAIKSNIK